MTHINNSLASTSFSRIINAPRDNFLSLTPELSARALSVIRKMVVAPYSSKVFSALNICNITPNSSHEEIISSLHENRVPSKAEISYSLVEYQTSLLVKLTERCRSIPDPLKRKKYFYNEMKKLGYKEVKIKVKDGKKEFEVFAWSKPSTKYMVHTCPFWLINQKVRLPLVNPSLRDDTYILNNNAKLCVSIVNSDNASIFQPTSRAGLIMKTPPKSILDTFPSDRLSPVGFKKTKSEVESMSTSERTSYESQIKHVDDFVVLLKKYKALVGLVRHLGDAMINVLLAKEKTLKESDRIELENLLAGIDPLTKKVLLDPKASEFEDNPAIMQYLNRIEDIYMKYRLNIEHKLNKMFHKDNSYNFISELREIKSFVKKILIESKEWSATNIHPMASKWEEAIRDRKEVFASRLMPMSIYGPSSLTWVGENKTDHFVEINVSTESLEIAGFFVDLVHLEEDSNSKSYVLDLNESRQIIDKEINPIVKRLTELKNKKNQSKISKEELDELKKLETKKRTFEKIQSREELTNLVIFAFNQSIPLIISSE